MEGAGHIPGRAPRSRHFRGTCRSSGRQLTRTGHVQDGPRRRAGTVVHVRNRLALGLLGYHIAAHPSYVAALRHGKDRTHQTPSTDDAEPSPHNLIRDRGEDGTHDISVAHPGQQNWVAQNRRCFPLFRNEQGIPGYDSRHGRKSGTVHEESLVRAQEIRWLGMADTQLERSRRVCSLRGPDCGLRDCFQRLCGRGAHRRWVDRRILGSRLANRHSAGRPII